MKRFFLVLFLALIALSAGCRLPPVQWPKLIECAPGISDLVGVVSRILLADGPAEQLTISDRAKGELEQLGRDYGPGTVACVVEQVLSDWTKPGAAQEPLRLGAVARGRDFMLTIGVNAKLSDTE